MSALAIVLTSTFCFSVWQKHKQTKERQQTSIYLDKYYKDKLNLIYYVILKIDREDTQYSAWKEESDYNWLKETKDHMCKDGYNWQQIEQMEKKAESEQNERKWNTDSGYEDGFNGTEPNEYSKDNMYYQFGFKKGLEKKKSLINKN